MSISMETIQVIFSVVQDEMIVAQAKVLMYKMEKSI